MGEVVLSIDTDLDVPRLPARLRIDLFHEDGSWFESRDFARPDPRDWPMTFGVYSSDESRPRDVLVRLRAYPEGRVRDYFGERPEPRTYEPPHVAHDLADACARAPRIGMGEEATVRRGGLPITRAVEPACRDRRGGSAAVRVAIPARGRYRFGIVGAAPQHATGDDPVIDRTLFVRASCDQESSEIGCTAAKTLDLDLEAGEVTVLTGSADLGEPADLTIRADRAASFSDAPAHTAPAPPPAPLTFADSSRAPTDEPEPGVTIDRLVVVHVEPRARTRVDIVLYGACAGTQADLGIEDGRARLDRAKSCVDTDRMVVPVARAAPSDGPRAPSAAGSFAPEEACEPGWPKNDVACIPGGAFLLGGVDASGFAEESSTPERLAVIRRFYLDVHEVSVERWRKALAAGLKNPDPDTPFAKAPRHDV
jgi:hypothetical protein